LKTYPTATPGAVMFDTNEKEFEEEVAWTLDELREKLPKVWLSVGLLSLLQSVIVCRYHGKIGY